MRSSERTSSRSVWLRACLLCGLLIAAAIGTQAQSSSSGEKNALVATTAEAPAAPSPQQVLYDRYIRVSIPSGWEEKRSWELGDDRSLPLYNPATESVLIVWGFDRPLYRSGYIESLASGNRLSGRMEMDLSLWSSEVLPYYDMIWGGLV